MPSEDDMQELIDNCDWKWMNKNGIAGYSVTGPNRNSIFLPAAGCRYDSSLNDSGSNGYYWSSTPDGSQGACALYFDDSSRYVDYDHRYYGQSVRAVSK